MRQTPITQHKLDEKPGLTLVFMLLACLCLIRLLALYFSKTDLFFDEAQYWSWSETLDFGYFSKPPLLAWLIRGATETCGSSEFCIRSLSPLFYTITSVFIYLCARRLYTAQIAMWAALAFATLPAVSFSSTLISTDVPLLLCWAAALWALVGLLQTNEKKWSFILGLALGCGLLAKYAMVYFLACFALLCVIAPEARRLLKDIRLWCALVIASLILLPNIIWNINNHFATFAHTAENANWGRSLLHPGKALEFFGAQFGVFGPILFTALLIIFWRSIRLLRSGSATVSFETKLLLSFSVPIILVILTQAFLSRAHANWAATAYPAATILVIATLLTDRARKTFYASFALHGIVVFVFAIGIALAGTIMFPGKADPFERVLGWREGALTSYRKMQEQGLNTIVADDRGLTAELLYYLRDKKNIEILAWKEGQVPKDHYQLTRPFLAGASDKTVLLVSLSERPDHILSKFSQGILIGTEKIAAGPKNFRPLYYYRLSGYKAGRENR